MKKIEKINSKWVVVDKVNNVYQKIRSFEVRRKADLWMNSDLYTVDWPEFKEENK